MPNFIPNSTTFPGQSGGVIFAFIALGIVCLVLWRWLRAKRARRLLARGVCPSCGYSLKGLACAALCPECGGRRVGS